MKLLLLNYEFPPLGGGAGNATYYLLKELAGRADIQVSVVTSSADKFEESKMADNITIYYLDIGKGGQNKHFQTQKDLLRYSWKAYWFSRRLKAQEKYDLVHAFFGIPCGYIAMKLKLPYIVSLRGSDVPFYNKRFELLDKLIFKRLSRKIWQRAAAVVANSADLRALARQSSPQLPIDIVVNGVDTYEFRPGRKDDGEFTVLSTARLIERKGVEYLLAAFIKFQKEYPHSKLLLAGDGDLKDDLQVKAQEEGVQDKVEFLGVVSHSDIASLYRQADVFVLPSLNEGMSNALLEAAAAGLAIVTTPTGGAAQLVEKQTGMIVTKQDSGSIYEALSALYKNPQQLAEMKKNSRRVAENMDWAKVAEAYLDYYRGAT